MMMQQAQALQRQSAVGPSPRLGSSRLKPLRRYDGSNPNVYTAHTRIRIAQPSVDVSTSSTRTGREEHDAQVHLQGEALPDGFSWTKHWYPVGSARDLDPAQPHSIELLGGRFVLWADSQGAWHCQQDLCPHRLAPLSEGKVVGDTIQCSYHGWRFQGDGSCVSIPQAPAAVKASACSNKRACVQSYPNRVQHGLVWVWPDTSDASWLEAAAAPTAQDAPPTGAEWREILPLYAREFPYSLQTFFENTLDPAHVPWSHHGVIGDRNKAGPLGMKVHQDVCPQGVAARYVSVSSKGTGAAGADEQGSAATGADSTPSKEGYVQTVVSFKAPHTLVYDFVRGNGTKGKLMSYCTPTRPGWVRSFSLSMDTSQSVPSKLMTHSMPEWLAHLLFLEGGDGDSVLLKAQEELLPRLKRGWREYYTPTDADVGVQLWRRWLDKYTSARAGPYQLAAAGAALPGMLSEAAAAVPVGGDAMTTLKKEQLLDRYAQHTRSCSACRGAMVNFARLKLVAAVGAIACAQLAFLCLLQLPPAGSYLAGGSLLPAQGVQLAGVVLPQHVVAAALWGVLAALAAKLSAAFDAMRQAFVYKNYVHAFR